MFEAIVHAIQRVFLLGIVAGALAVILAIFMNRGAIDLNQQQALKGSETPQAIESVQGPSEKGVSGNNF